jgi:ribosomal protein S2
VNVAISSPKCRARSGHKEGKRCFENMAEFRYLGTTITNQKQIQEEIKRR